jgi:uncharacterized repeat protein (TIGR03803 family)
LTITDNSNGVAGSQQSVSLSGTGISAQTFTTLLSFDGANGLYPHAALLQGTDGNLYGSTSQGGLYASAGTLFKMTTAGDPSTIYNFCALTNCADGAFPVQSLIQTANGDFYGATYYGGANGTGTGITGDGTVFTISPSGVLTTLYTFCRTSGCPDGSNPNGGLILATNGYFYGTTFYGGSHGSGLSGGTVFRMTASGALTTLYSFCSESNCADGSNPNWIIQAIDGDFYGVTQYGGSKGQGTVFKITPAGKFSILHSFCGSGTCGTGALPQDGLIQASDGNLYGTAFRGGLEGCTGFGCGTIFKVSPSTHALTGIYSFCAQGAPCNDGSNPYGGLIQGTDGNLYGTTYNGGAYGYGTIFMITLGGELTSLYSFCAGGGSCPDGSNPVEGLTQDTNGYFYGTTFGSALGDAGSPTSGTIFSLNVGLQPFVETEPTSGKAGTTVRILGTDLTGATSVTFNGTPAVFKVVSSSEITTKVPTGATSGSVQAVTPSGTLSSNVAFLVP